MVWPPAPKRDDNLFENEPAEASMSVQFGYRFLWLSLLCNPLIFLPFAFYYGSRANRESGSGAGNQILLLGALLLILAAGISAVLVHMDAGK